MESPQYRDEEAIKVAVYPDALRGDLKEIKTLNQYIGVTVPAELPQCNWMPKALLGAAVFGLIAVFLPPAIRKWSLVAIPTALSFSLLFAAVQAKQQMYDIGHHRTQKTPLRGVKDFTPPFLGKTRLFQFEVESKLGLASFLIAGAIALQFGGAWFSRKNVSTCSCKEHKTRTTNFPTKKALA
jgi:hypothetical protein